MNWERADTLSCTQQERQDYRTRGTVHPPFSDERDNRLCVRHREGDRTKEDRAMRSQVIPQWELLVIIFGG